MWGEDTCQPNLTLRRASPIPPYQGRSLGQKQLKPRSKPRVTEWQMEQSYMAVDVKNGQSQRGATVAWRKSETPKPVALCGWMPWSWHRDSGSVSKGKSPAAQMGLWYRYQYQQKKDLKQRLTVKEGEDQTFQQVKSVDVIHKSWAALYGLKGFSFWSWYKKLLSNLKSPQIVSNPLIYLDGNSMQLF